MRIVLDTNVFVSGLFWKGPPSKILDAWKKGKLKLVLSTEILDEYRRILSGFYKKYSIIEIEQILDLVSLHAEVVPSISFARPVCADRDDDKFLAAALSGQVLYIVTGDRILLTLKKFHHTQIITPKRFLDFL